MINSIIKEFIEISIRLAITYLLGWLLFETLRMLNPGQDVEHQGFLFSVDGNQNCTVTLENNQTIPDKSYSYHMIPKL